MKLRLKNDIEAMSMILNIKSMRQALGSPSIFGNCRTKAYYLLSYGSCEAKLMVLPEEVIVNYV